MIELPRRKFLTGLMGLVAAPAVVHAESLMKVRAIATPKVLTLAEYASRIVESDEHIASLMRMYADAMLYGVGNCTLEFPGLAPMLSS